MQPRSSLGRSLGRAHKLARTLGDRELAPHGSSVSEWIVLYQILHAPAPGASQTEIARHADMGGPALVRHIDRLEADGFVTRTRDATDRRVIRLALTTAGRARVGELEHVMADLDANLRSAMTKQEAAVVIRALEKLFDHCQHQLSDDPRSVA